MTSLPTSTVGRGERPLHARPNVCPGSHSGSRSGAILSPDRHLVFHSLHIGLNNPK